MQYVYQVTFKVHGLRPRFLERIFPGIPTVKDRLESMILRLEKRVTTNEELEIVKQRGKDEFGQTRVEENIEYAPKVELLVLTYLGED